MKNMKIQLLMYIALINAPKNYSAPFKEKKLWFLLDVNTSVHLFLKLARCHRIALPFCY